MSVPVQRRTYQEKMAQATREAKATCVALVLMVLVWVVLGFGLSGLELELFSTPLWVIGGTVGVWLVSIVIVVVLRLCVFEDFDLGEEKGEGHE